MSSANSNYVIMSYIRGYVTSGTIRVTREPLSKQINQVVMTQDAAQKLNEFGANCFKSTAAKNQPELENKGLTYVTTLGDIATLAPEVAGAIELATEVRIKPITSKNARS